MLQYTQAFSGFSVNDLASARKFYADALGFTVADHPMGLLALHTTGNQPILLYPKPDHVPASFTVLNFVVADIEQTVDRLISKGVQFEQYKAPIQTDNKGICRNDNGPLIAWFKDPAGNILSVIENR